MNSARVMKNSLLINLTLSLGKILFGLVFNSRALFSDGIHSLSDTLTDVFVIIGIRISKKPADDDHPFGHGKSEYIITLFLGIFIGVIAFTLAQGLYESWGDEIVKPSIVIIIFSLFSVIIKLILSTYLLKKGKELKSVAIQASGKESRADSMSSFFVLLGLSLTYIGQVNDITYLKHSEKIATIIVILFILKVAIEILMMSISSLIGKECDVETANDIKRIANKVEGVARINNLNTMMHGYFIEVLITVVVDGNISVKEGHDIATVVHNELLKDDRICFVSVHVEPK